MATAACEGGVWLVPFAGSAAAVCLAATPEARQNKTKVQVRFMVQL
jgi:hypothetical protein